MGRKMWNECDRNVNDENWASAVGHGLARQRTHKVYGKQNAKLFILSEKKKKNVMQ